MVKDSLEHKRAKEAVYHKYRVATLRGYKTAADYWWDVWINMDQEGYVLNHRPCNGTFSCQCSICELDN